MDGDFSFGAGGVFGRGVELGACPAHRWLLIPPVLVDDLPLLLHLPAPALLRVEGEQLQKLEVVLLHLCTEVQLLDFEDGGLLEGVLGLGGGVLGELAVLQDVFDLLCVLHALEAGVLGGLVALNALGLDAAEGQVGALDGVEPTHALLAPLLPLPHRATLLAAVAHLPLPLGHHTLEETPFLRGVFGVGGGNAVDAFGVFELGSAGWVEGAAGSL